MQQLVTDNPDGGLRCLCSPSIFEHLDFWMAGPPFTELAVSGALRPKPATTVCWAIHEHPCPNLAHASGGQHDRAFAHAHLVPHDELIVASRDARVLTLIWTQRESRDRLQPIRNIDGCHRRAPIVLDLVAANCFDHTNRVGCGFDRGALVGPLLM